MFRWGYGYVGLATEQPAHIKVSGALEGEFILIEERSASEGQSKSGKLLPPGGKVDVKVG